MATPPSEDLPPVLDWVAPHWLISSQIEGYTLEKPSPSSSSMVLRPISEPESFPLSTPMASSVKSRPIHNSPLNELNWPPAGPSWAQQRFYRQLSDSIPTQLPPLVDSAGPDGGNSCHLSLSEDHVHRERGRHQEVAAVAGSSLSILVPFGVQEKPSAPHTANTAEAAAALHPVDQDGAPATSQISESGEHEERMPKVQNRKRRRPSVAKNSKTGNRSALDNVQFSVHLKKDEIESDLLSIMGSRQARRQARRSTKRPRIIQQAINNCFPGLWLANITARSYKVVAKHS
ncbi:hypothetical protein SAY87_024907 [Trapa incisa]|uniref:Uncharacterized protein n=1 Tax=Trapa incisa TaxID=236973 RepID=A0AAN7GGM9_9MYRT|nr:hypothetical protein SAY87_024907 [Trapa incisa]